jgi:23S rRNA (cytidine1920-2'-O)/16S rRNA (cytidine1409-2'-O)-methyltransferase
VRGQDRYVSRGGHKLEGALTGFSLDLAGLRCLDLGSSTGGFTDCLLQHGARAVVAIDVGQGQLHWKLRNDPRVTLHEGVNARELGTAPLAGVERDSFDLVVADVSFISLRLVLPPAFDLLHSGGRVVALIKPQFEAGPGAVGSKGVVRDPAVHAQVCERIGKWWAALPGWRVLGIAESPITGPEGNREFLIAARREGVSS